MSEDLDILEDMTEEEFKATYHGGKVISDHASNIKLRNMVVTGPVDEEMSAQICKNLLMLNAEDPDTPIAMHINTYGGTVYDMMAIYDVMQFIKAPIYTVGFGKVMSAGTLLLAAGEKGHRYCLPHTSIMIHKVKGGANGAVEDIASSMKHMNELQLDMEKLLRKHSKINTKQIKKFMAGVDIFIKPRKAIELGIVDKVTGVMPRIMH